MGSNTMARGMYTLMADIIKYFPSPDKCKCAGINTTNNEVFEADYDFSKPKSAYIYKTIADPYIGKYSLIKVNSGVLKPDDVLYNYHRSAEERLGKLYVICGNKVEEVKELHAGDLGALAKLSVSQTTDSLSTKKNAITYIRTPISQPYVYRKYAAVKGLLKSISCVSFQSTIVPSNSDLCRRSTRVLLRYFAIEGRTSLPLKTVKPSSVTTPEAVIPRASR
jgi:elongation factor G